MSKSTCAILFIITIMTSCFNNRWTEKQRKEFETKCAQTDTFNNVLFQFIGFGNDEFDSILIKDYNGSTLVDSFKVFVWPAQGPYALKRKERSATIVKMMNIKHKYHFIIPGQRPYVLADMKMVMWAQYSMTSEGWGCIMGDYTIDNVKFEHNGNPTFVKRDTCYMR